MSSRSGDPESSGALDGEAANGASWALSNVAMAALDEYGLPLAQLCIAFLYSLYRRITLFNMTLFLLKYIPTGLYMYKTLKGAYVTPRERIKQKQMELEDIKLQIQIVNTKLLCVRDAEFTERGEQLRRGAERLRAARGRVRDTVAADDSLRRAMDSAALWGHDAELHGPSTPEEERELIITLLKELKSSEQVSIPERQPDKMECGEHMPCDDITPENSVYSSLSDGDTKQDCRIKIVKVTNVYKVAYLKHYIKQKRLRRATQQALLKKKIESIKKLLEGWQKSLNAVINSKLLLDTPIDLASQEAMGDFSKPNLRESFDSDSDLRTNNGTDNFFDEYSLSWAQNPYRSYGFSYHDMQQPGATKEFCETQEFTNDMKFSDHITHGCDFTGPKGGSNVLFILPEETSSQVAIEEIKGESAEYELDCRDMVAL